jgi:DNA topoisomerase III, bacteria and conjugative plasmid
MRLIISEKHSVAQSISTVLGAKERKDGYIQGEDIIVTWCVGHLVELAQAHAYNERYAKWRREDLPILPDEWQFVSSEGTKKQFAVLKKLLHDPRVDTVVCATDAGREGELIFRLVYAKCGCTKPVKRLWISSLEESAIRNGFLSLRDGSDYDLLYQAALCRAKADWLVGINATRLFSILYGQKLNVGRVMSPTLALIVVREADIFAFQPEAFYTVQLDGGFIAQSERISSKEEAEHIQRVCHLQTALVQKIERKSKTEKPPKLYDLTTLQRDANRIFGYTAQQTLDYAQSLYEKKLITYPRTDSRYLTSDMADKLTGLARQSAMRVTIAACLDIPVHPKQVIDDTKVTDHHAIIPTMPNGQHTTIPAPEQDIYNLITIRLLCAVGDAYCYNETTVSVMCKGYTFHAKGRTIRQMGWQILENIFRGSLGSRGAPRIEQSTALPEMSEGLQLSPVIASIKEGKTTPPKHFTEDSLLGAMETAGVEDMPEDAERKGLGTPATRAGMIEKLVKIGLIERKGDKNIKHLLPTVKGMALITVLPEQLQSPSMTAEWEHRLMQIQRGDANAEDFLNDIAAMLEHLTKTVQPVPGADTLFPSDRVKLGSCPCCGAAVSETTNGFFCENGTCSFGIWKNSRFFEYKNKPSTAETMIILLSDERARSAMLRYHQMKRNRQGEKSE